MKREILSLKSIYRFLTLNDYPIYSEGIIKKDNRIGLTLTKFCYENILVDFRNRKCGKVLWRTEGARNRYVSEICNRSNRLSIYSEYAEEIAVAIDSESILRQVQQFMAFLLERQFNMDAFMKKLPAYIELFQREDEAFTKEASAFFKSAIQEYKELENQGMMTDAFCSGWMLTFFMFHALMGNGEGEEVLHKLRADKNYSLTKLYQKYQLEQIQTKHEVKFLTGINTELSGQPLKAGHFFGRESEMFELREMLLHGGAYLISGMGGIGKTELMRQFLKCCHEESLVDYICVVQYEGGLAQSLVKAFSEVHGTDLMENFSEAIARIRIHTDKHILLVIDNMDGNVDETELEMLLKLPVTIFVTSRYQQIKGFKTYRLKPIGKEAGALIFRDNYGTRLTEKDKVFLEEIINEDVWRHVLTLRLLAKTAKNNRWNLQKLQTQLKLGATPVGYTESEHYEGLKQVYEQMYEFSNLTKEEHELLRLFAALPYRNYDILFVREYLQCMLSQDSNIEVALEKFWASGWLEKSESGYSIHPFVAECVLSALLTEKEIIPFVENIIDKWQQMGESLDADMMIEVQYRLEKYLDAHLELVNATMMVYPLIEKITGKLSNKYTSLYMLSATILNSYYGALNVSALKKIQEKTEDIAKEIDYSISLLECMNQKNNVEAFVKQYEVLVENDNISTEFICNYAAVLGSKLFGLGKVEEAEALFDYVFANCKNPAIFMELCYRKAEVVGQKGDIAAYVEWLEKGINFAQGPDYERTKGMAALLTTLCNIYIILGRYEDAEKILEKTEQINALGIYFLQAMNYLNRGTLALYKCEGDYGVADMEQSVKLAKAVYSDEVEGGVASYMMNLAVAYQKNKQFEEAEDLYKELIESLRKMPSFKMNTQTMICNFGAMYLEWDKPQESLNYLLEAYAMGEELGSRAKGEAANNLSKAYRALSNREKEVEYLKEAIPLLEEVYGSEHPKVVDAKARLEE